MVNGQSIFVLQSRAMAFVVEPFHSRIKSKLSSRIINTINRKSNDLFRVEATEIQNDNLFAC